MKKMLLLLAVFLWTGLQVSIAQSRTVKGRVLDENGDGIPGASVTVKGTQSGTVTDMDGKYELIVPEDRDALIINSLSNGTQEVKVGLGTEELVTTMKESSTQDLGEVNIYGQKVDRKSFTGAISTVTAADIAKRPVTDIAKALEGAAPGLSVTSGGGQPGASPDIQIRGQNTLSASSAPLIVLDGAPYSGTLVSIPPGDVESMVVLKDAAATSIYGSRGANGVILITTKRGVNTGKPRISIDASVGTLNRFMPLYETLGAKEYMETAFYAYANGPGKVSGQRSARDFVNYIGGYNPFRSPSGTFMNITTLDGPLDILSGTVNPDAVQLYNDSWFDEMNRTGLRHNYNLAVSNGDNKSDYYFSIGYTNDQGIVKNSTYDRISSRLTVNSNITDWLKAGMSLAASMDNQRFFVGDQQAYINPFMTAQNMAPIYPVYRYDSTGTIMTDAKGDPQYDFGVNDSNNPAGVNQNRPFATNMNPIAALSQDDRSTKALNGFGNTYLEAKFLKDFNFKTTFGMNYYNGRQNQFQNMLFGDAQNIGGRMDRTLAGRITYTFNQVLTWKPSFGIFKEGHNLDFVLGHENYYLRDDNANIERSGFVSSLFQEGAAAAIGTGSTTSFSELAMESYFSMLSYNYKNKYYLSGSLRTDGSSRFAAATRWGTFWSVGAGWVMNEEAFLKDVSWLTELKLRGSYGITGNEALNAAGHYAWMPKYSFYSNNSNPGLIFSTWGNEALMWESNFKFNIGFDFGLFANRITGTVDYFLSGADNLLFVRPFAPSVGTGGIYDNVGSMQNSGVELQLNGAIVRSRNFDWNVRLNLTHLRNKVTKVQTEDSLLGGGTIFAKGLPVNSFFLPHFAGVDPESGAPMYTKADGSIERDYLMLTREDYRVVGSSFRDLEGAFSSDFRYRNFDLSFMFSFGIGGKFYDGIYASLMTSTRGQSYHKDILKAWRKPGDITDVPKAEYDVLNQSPLSDRFLVSNSFLNLKNINVGYTLPAKTLSNLKLTSLRIYIAADNIYYLSARKGLDVQQAFFGSSSFNYFPYRTLMFGLNLGL